MGDSDPIVLRFVYACLSALLRRGPRPGIH
jgi:hypothetical protein